MRISNKLNTADFVELQKILMENYSPGKTMFYLLKYLVNFLYALVVFLAFYFILKRIAGIDNMVVPALTGLITFILLIYYFPKIYTGRLNRAIERFYAKNEMQIERELVLDEQGITSRDEKGEKSFLWTDFVRIVRSAGNYFFTVKNADEGFILKADHLSLEESAELDAYLRKTGLNVEERNHG
jgi:hypothetical protein